MEDKILILKNEVGSEYLEELKHVIQLRIDRKKIYNNSFLDEKT